MVADDVTPINFGIHAAWRKVADREGWGRVIDTTIRTSREEYAKKKKNKKKEEEENNNKNFNCIVKCKKIF